MTTERGLPGALVVIVVLQICLLFEGLYDPMQFANKTELFVRVLRALGMASFIMAGVYFLVPTLLLGRGVFLISALLVIYFVIGLRVAFAWAISD
jgi:hypothetical protein